MSIYDPNQTRIQGFSEDAKSAMLANPEYFVWWYTIKSVALCATIAILAFVIGKNSK